MKQSAFFSGLTLSVVWLNCCPLIQGSTISTELQGLVDVSCDNLLLFSAAQEIEHCHNIHHVMKGTGHVFQVWFFFLLVDRVRFKCASIRGLTASAVYRVVT